jgi:hypothetical protein
VAVGQQLPGVEANFLNSNSASNAGASSAQLGNTSTQANAFNAASPFGTIAQNLTAPSTETQSSSQGSSQSQSQNSNTAYVPSVGPHNIGAKGGAIPDNDSDDVPTQGGPINASMSPSHGAITDDINAHVNSDEFIIPRDVALWKGQEFFQKLIMQSRQGLANAPAKPDNPAPPNHPDKPQVASREFRGGANARRGGAIPEHYAGGGNVGGMPDASLDQWIHQAGKAGIKFIDPSAEMDNGVPVGDTP